MNDVRKLHEKMVTACQSGSKKAWRKAGKALYLKKKELNLPIEKWMEDHFGRICKT